jgi:hypothetical protein
MAPCTHQESRQLSKCYSAQEVMNAGQVLAPNLSSVNMTSCTFITLCVLPGSAAQLMDWVELQAASHVGKVLSHKSPASLTCCGKVEADEV